MRTLLTTAAVLVFVVSTGLLEMGKGPRWPLITLPPALSTFEPAALDTMTTSSTTPHRLDER